MSAAGAPDCQNIGYALWTAHAHGSMATRRSGKNGKPYKITYSLVIKLRCNSVP
jgi:hypothetical protein